jgi:hydrocephalus-inducing protein
MSSVPEDEPLFQPFPPEINFSDYEPCEKYTAVLKLRNNDKVSISIYCRI